MDPWNSAGLVRYFEALWGYGPFAWQRALGERLLTGDDWPEAIALPTGAGKTACLDLAVFALASAAGNRETEAPRRIFYVVDRRVIVDAAYERATELARRLKDAEEGPLREVADRLRRLARGGEQGWEEEIPLEVHILRGGMYRSEGWARSPLQPSVVATTVDQLGSRLLFRAYGRGPGMWPIYAGLIANDSLILLDEAHCARPFNQTLRAVTRYGAWAHQPVGRPLRLVVMSATPPAGLERFTDPSSESRDPRHPLGRRVLASKPASLAIVTGAKGRQAHRTLAKALAASAAELAAGDPKAVVVFANRVATAREAHRLLVQRHHLDAVLLTGRMRPLDKDAVVREHLAQLLTPAASARVLEASRIVVATQTLEVGADLDFDALVTECAPLDALRQRLGRLNRNGRAIDAPAVVLVREDQAEDSDDDPVYGAALAATWGWLREVEDRDGAVDLGTAGLERHLSGSEPPESLAAPAPDAPVMLPAHLDAWVQTSPVPDPSPGVGPFLRGPLEVAADVQVCLRVLPAPADSAPSPALLERWLDVLSICPPAVAEALPVPIGLFRRWMRGAAGIDDSADIEGLGGSEAEGSGEGARGVLRWRGRATGLDDLTADPGAIRPGDVVVLPVESPDLDLLGDLPARPAERPALLDLGDVAHLRARARGVLRLQPALIDCWPAPDELKERARGLLALPDDDPEGLLAAVRELLEGLVRTRDTAHAQAGTAPSTWLSIVARALATEAKRRAFLRAIKPIPEGLALVGERLVPGLLHGAESFTDEDDASASRSGRASGAGVSLAEHLPGVADYAGRYARATGLPARLVEALALAGRYHDLGKVDPRFQALLQGGNPWAVPLVPLAKSGALPASRGAWLAAREAAGYPEGGRHELLSVRLAEQALEARPASRDDIDRDLVLHLVASHHGRCRPLAPVVEDPEPVPARFVLDGPELTWDRATGLERLDSGVAERFWRLVRRYGWWGLAWMEALLRLADHRRSEWEEKDS